VQGRTSCSPNLACKGERREAKARGTACPRRQKEKEVFGVLSKLNTKWSQVSFKERLEYKPNVCHTFQWRNF
jgi:hypothetical protein